ncbi:MAG: LysM peptidoglycan-binding domain-containing protein [Gammaproteobacteria bacterium]
MLTIVQASARAVTPIILTLFLVACAAPAKLHRGSAQPHDKTPPPTDADSDPDQLTLHIPPWAYETPDIEFPAPQESQDNSIWSHLREGFQFPGRDDHPAVKEYLDWHAAHPGYMKRVTERAAPYMRLIMDEIQARQMPLDLALVPIIESSFVPQAVSSRHAAGLWQFIPTTGDVYGLKRNWWYDGRRDVLASTRAALTFLSELHERYDGDWLLALAAYNAGPGTVNKALKRNRKRGKPADFWHLELPRETSRYIPKLLAAKTVIEAPEHYEIELFPVPNEAYLTSVATGGQIDLQAAADLAGIEADVLYRLNPGFNRWATDPQGPHELLLPIDKADKFEQALTGLPGEKRVTWLRHKIKSGDTLSHIAEQHRISVAALRQANNMKDNRIRAGRFLLVPRSLRAAAPPPKTPESKQGAHKDAVHVVRINDSLWTVARKYGVTIEDIADASGISIDSTLRPGDRLTIARRARASFAAVELKSVPRRRPPSPALGALNPLHTVTYQVRQGDSLYLIARRFKVSIADLRRWNALSSSNLIKPGQDITLHVDSAQLSQDG